MVHLLEEKTVFKGKKRSQSRRSLSMFKLYYATFHPVKSREARKLLHILLNDTEVGLVPVFSINLSRIGNVTAWKRKKEKKKVTQFFLQISTFELLFEQSIIMIGKVETIFVSCLKIERSKWIDGWDCRIFKARLKLKFHPEWLNNRMFYILLKNCQVEKKLFHFPVSKFRGEVVINLESIWQSW